MNARPRTGTAFFDLWHALRRAAPASFDSRIRKACQLLTIDDRETQRALPWILRQIDVRYSAPKDVAAREAFEQSIILSIPGLLAEFLLGDACDHPRPAPLDRLLARLLLARPDKFLTSVIAIFDKRIDGAIRKHLPGRGNDTNREDARQYIYQQIIEKNYWRLREYKGEGSVSGFLFSVIDLLSIDFFRKYVMPRRRLPAAIESLPSLEQEVFRQVYWFGEPKRSNILARVLAGRIAPPPSEGEVEAALVQVERSRPHDGRSDSIEPGDDLADHAESPETFTLPRIKLRDALQNPKFTEEEQTYIRAALGIDQPLPVEEIARRLEWSEGKVKAIALLIEKLPTAFRLYIQSERAFDGPPTLEAIAARLEHPVELVRRVAKQARDAPQELRDYLRVVHGPDPPETPRELAARLKWEVTRVHAMQPRLQRKLSHQSSVQSSVV